MQDQVVFLRDKITIVTPETAISAGIWYVSFKFFFLRFKWNRDLLQTLVLIIKRIILTYQSIKQETISAPGPLA